MRSPKPEQSKTAARTFEASLARLEEIVARLEDSEASLEEAISLVQEADELARYCEQQLRAAEGKVLQLVERIGGVDLEPLTPEAEAEGT